MSCSIKSVLLATLLFILFQSCKEKGHLTPLSGASIIPKPVSIVDMDEKFTLKSGAKILVAKGDKNLFEIANIFSARLKVLTGFQLPVESASDDPEKGSIYLTMEGVDPKVGAEGYELSIGEDFITINATQPAGVFMGMQTLLQIMPTAKSTTDQYALATGIIHDYPTYAWRGSMIDVARHFFSVEDVKRYIDLISYYKMNILHLHLSDDQGWRIEIKSWPNLALHGGSTQVGGEKGGYYTQEQYKDIVAYAAIRYITVVPEIDLPGHINSALASYGELNGGTVVPIEGRYKGQQTTQGILGAKSKPTELYTGISVGWSTLRVEKPESFKFVDDVLRELAAITPGPYLHIGGDEAHVTKKEDYIVFVNRFSEIVKAHGKKMIGWEEIAQANIDENTIAQHWASPKYAQMAAEKGAQIIMSPSPKVYLDMQYDSTTKLGLHWAAYIEVDDAYNWDPATQVEGVNKEQILGVEAPLWSETLVTMKDIEYMLFPRLPGIAEIGWSPAEGKSWDEYKVRLGNHAPFMKAFGIGYYPSKKIQWVQ